MSAASWWQKMSGNDGVVESGNREQQPTNGARKLKYQPDSITHRRIGSGLSWLTAALFIVADMAGGGVVAIPIALLNSGLFLGSLSMLLICLAFCYTAHILGRNWVTMCKRWPNVYGRDHCRKPYPEMAYRAMGERAHLFTSCTLNALLFGVCVVYLLLAAKIISELWALINPAHAVGPCMMILVLAAAFWPITFLKSPQDFWWAIVTAMLTTAFSVFLILVGTFLDLPVCSAAATKPPFASGKFFLSIGIFFFAFGGHGVFPTIQHDMRRPRQFTRSSVLAFAIVSCMYVPISYLGVFVYGNSLHDSIISSIQTGIIQLFANLFIAIHCVLTLTIVINPLNQELEHLLNTPHHFCWQRVLVRSGILLSVVFVALTVPSFGPILNLMGGTFIALISAIMPCLFYLYLHAADGGQNGDNIKNGKKKITASETKNNVSVLAGGALPSAADNQPIEPPMDIPTFRQVIKRTPTITLMLNLVVIVLAILCGIAATNSALLELYNSSFSGPCYFSSSIADDAEMRPAVEAIHCCGAHRNISRYPDTFTCPAYNER